LIVLIPQAAEAQARCANVAGASAWFTFEESMFDPKGPESPQRIAGVVGRALRFDGKRQYWEAPASTRGLDAGDGDFTVELWIRPQPHANAVNVVDKRSNLPLGYLLFLYKGYPGFQVSNGDHHNHYSRTKTITDGRWHHVAGVVRRLPPTPIRLFIDGVLDPAHSGPVPLANLDVPAPLWLGRHHRNGRINRDDIYFSGDLDELAIFKRALTQADVKAIFNAGPAGKCKPKTSLGE
jgi:hypothetical protein